MSEPPLETLEFLLQVDVIGSRLPMIGKGQWQALYFRVHEASLSFTMWSGLLDDAAAARAIERDSWDLRIDDYRPGFSQSWRDGREATTYHSRGGDEGARPIVRCRSFDGAFPSYFEVDEEFRLYHNLAEDKRREVLLDFDASGREIDVVRLKENAVEARIKYLRQFQAGTGLHLAVFIDSRRYSRLALADVPIDERERVETDSGIRWRRNVAQCDFNRGYATFSRLLSKVILPPPARGKAGIWPFEDDGAHEPVRFIIGVDADGKDVEYTSDPDALANNFGANPSAPHYLTPVYFRREVLAKYFAEPERYEVSDGRLTCLSLWSCQIDNDLDSHVVVFLGDLGRDLPYEERLHWRQFNIAPEGGISETNFRRSFLSQFADAQAADLAFRHEYANTMRDWQEVHGWPLFLTPSAGDCHLLSTVRIPVTNSQAELDEQVGYLTKLLVDSLNERELEAHTGSLDEGAKGITKFDRFLERIQFPERQKIIQLLRDLQALRSAGSAHRKGSAYDKMLAKLGLDPAKKADIMRRLLEEAVEGLRAIRLHCCGGLEQSAQ
ncbi:MAG: hypothetical protein ABSF25_11215 [Bryobacteraceae bacterium]|jgi:hypothetical protein